MSHLTFLALAFLFLVYSAVMLDTVRKYNKGTAQEAKVRKQRLNVARMGTVIALGLFVVASVRVYNKWMAEGANTSYVNNLL